MQIDTQTYSPSCCMSFCPIDTRLLMNSVLSHQQNEWCVDTCIHAASSWENMHFDCLLMRTESSPYSNFSVIRRIFHHLASGSMCSKPCFSSSVCRCTWGAGHSGHVHITVRHLAPDSLCGESWRGGWQGCSWKHRCSRAAVTVELSLAAASYKATTEP